MPESVEQLLARIRELELEVSEREKDLGVFRRELTEANRRLEALIGKLNQELRVVHLIQKHLVPTEIPQIQGFEFSSKFLASFQRGGDYFDIFEHEDRSRFGIIVAAGSGHVMSALLLSVLLKLTGRMEGRRQSDPSRMVERIVSEMKPSITGEDSADLFYGVFDRRQFSLNYLKLGGIVALHFDYSGAALRLLKSELPPVRSQFDAAIVAQSVALNPRDKLIFCTPGVVEARNLEGQQFGEDRLYQAILEFANQGVHELRNQIFFRLQEFTAGQEPSRDQTVVVAEVKDKVIKLAKK